MADYCNPKPSSDRGGDLVFLITVAAAYVFAAGELLRTPDAARVVALAVAGSVRPLSPPVALTLYRVAQEALTNVRKHAHASRVDLTLST